MSLDLHHLIAPYALNSLEADDRSRFEAHLALCEQCRVELVGFLSTAARLGEAEAMTPPPELRERLVTMAASTSQEHPVVTAISQRSRMRRMAPRIGLVAAAAAAILGIGGFVAEHERADDLSAERSRVVAVMTAEDGSMTADDANGGGNVRVIASKSHNAAVVLGESLPTLDDDRTYQVWHMEDGKPTSVGLLGHGSGMLYVASIKGADAYAVTVEPDGGSPSPTSDPIATAPV
ncbi:anti-sigma factor [Aeromicrobium sp.]|uniref:anti-sigma factor n=1 Tax=Aeromicrobium sp. TaxID=1871063 RepID=UPI003D6BE9F3